MDRWTVLILACASSLCATPNATDIYQKTAKVLSIPEIKFQVTSTLSSGNYQEKRLFSLSRLEDGDTSSMLVCFASPSKIKGTAMLLKKNGNESQTHVYFPSIDRVRMIPKQNENEDAFGLGISYSEMQNTQSKLDYIRSFTQRGMTFHQISRVNGVSKTVYTIEAQTNLLEKMEMYDSDRLIKEIFIDETNVFKGKTVVTQWHIIDHRRGEKLEYKIDEKSMQPFVDEKQFSLSSLSHCKP